MQVSNFSVDSTRLTVRIHDESKEEENHIPTITVIPIINSTTNTSTNTINIPSKATLRGSFRASLRASMNRDRDAPANSTSGNSSNEVGPGHKRTNSDEQQQQRGLGHMAPTLSSTGRKSIQLQMALGKEANNIPSAITSTSAALSPSRRRSRSNSFSSTGGSGSGGVGEPTSPSSSSTELNTLKLELHRATTENAALKQRLTNQVRAHEVDTATAVAAAIDRERGERDRRLKAAAVQQQGVVRHIQEEMNRAFEKRFGAYQVSLSDNQLLHMMKMQEAQVKELAAQVTLQEMMLAVQRNEIHALEKKLVENGTANESSATAAQYQAQLSLLEQRHAKALAAEHRQFLESQQAQETTQELLQVHMNRGQELEARLETLDQDWRERLDEAAHTLAQTRAIAQASFQSLAHQYQQAATAWSHDRSDLFQQFKKKEDVISRQDDSIARLLFENAQLLRQLQSLGVYSMGTTPRNNPNVPSPSHASSSTTGTLPTSSIPSTTSTTATTSHHPTHSFGNVRLLESNYKPIVVPNIVLDPFIYATTLPPGSISLDYSSPTASNMHHEHTGTSTPHSIHSDAFSIGTPSKRRPPSRQTLGASDSPSLQPVNESQEHPGLQLPEHQLSWPQQGRTVSFTQQHPSAAPISGAPNEPYSRTSSMTSLHSVPPASTATVPFNFMDSGQNVTSSVVVPPPHEVSPSLLGISQEWKSYQAYKTTAPPARITVQKHLYPESDHMRVQREIEAQARDERKASEAALLDEEEHESAHGDSTEHKQSHPSQSQTAVAVTRARQGTVLHYVTPSLDLPPPVPSPEELHLNSVTRYVHPNRREASHSPSRSPHLSDDEGGPTSYREKSSIYTPLHIHAPIPPPLPPNGLSAKANEFIAEALQSSLPITYTSQTSSGYSKVAASLAPVHLASNFINNSISAGSQSARVGRERVKDLRGKRVRPSPTTLTNQPTAPSNDSAAHSIAPSISSSGSYVPPMSHMPIVQGYGSHMQPSAPLIPNTAGEDDEGEA